MEYDFIYDNIPLSGFGLTLCRFESSSMETVSAGSQISFELGTVPGREKRNLIDRSYQETLTAVFQAAKIENGIAGELSAAELSALMRWLNRRDRFCRFKLIREGYEQLYTYASFNVGKIEVSGKVVGLELSMSTLYPYLLEEQPPLICEISAEGLTLTLTDNSDEIGHIYPYLEICCRSEGDFSLSNSREERTTRIQGCRAGEIITLDGENLIVRSSDPQHRIPDDFNYVFPRIVNSFTNRENRLTAAGIDCTMTIRWSQIRKAGF